MDEFSDRIIELRNLLGLNNWVIDLDIREDASHEVETIADYQYFRAKMTIRPSILKLSDKDQDNIIVHELIHVVMALYDLYVDNSINKEHHEIIQSARESSVSQLSHIMMRLLTK